MTGRIVVPQFAKLREEILRELHCSRFAVQLGRTEMYHDLRRHGFDTWMLVNHFYNGMSPAMKQLLETMCGGDFLSKHPDEAMDFLNYMVETSKGWDELNLRELEKMRPSAHQRGGIFTLSEEMEMKAKISTLARKVEELEGKRLHEVKAVTENTA